MLELGEIMEVKRKAATATAVGNGDGRENRKVNGEQRKPGGGGSELRDLVEEREGRKEAVFPKAWPRQWKAEKEQRRREGEAAALWIPAGGERRSATVVLVDEVDGEGERKQEGGGRLLGLTMEPPRWQRRCGDEARGNERKGGGGRMEDKEDPGLGTAATSTAFGDKERRRRSSMRAATRKGRKRKDGEQGRGSRWLR